MTDFIAVRLAHATGWAKEAAETTTEGTGKEKLLAAVRHLEEARRLYDSATGSSTGDVNRPPEPRKPEEPDRPQHRRYR